MLYNVISVISSVSDLPIQIMMRGSLLKGILFVLPRRKKMPIAISYKMARTAALWVKKSGVGKTGG